LPEAGGFRSPSEEIRGSRIVENVSFHTYLPLSGYLAEFTQEARYELRERVFIAKYWHVL
jgi:hypothetical protein